MMAVIRLVAVIATALFALSSTKVWAAGQVTGITVNPQLVALGDSLNANVSFKIDLDMFGRGCVASVSLKYSDGSIEDAHPGFGVIFPTFTDIFLQPTKTGIVKVIAKGGTPSGLFTGWPPCGGSAQTQVNVKLKKTKKTVPDKPRKHKDHPINPAKEK